MEIVDEDTRITVSFNSESNPECMLPKANPCGNVLHLSRCFFVYDHFEKILSSIILENQQAWNAFSAV